MDDFLKLNFWNNTVLDYLLFLGSLIISIVIILIIKRVLLRHLIAWAKKTPTSLDDMILKAVKKYLIPLLYIVAVYLNTKWLLLSDTVANIIDTVALACGMIMGAVLISSAFIYFFNKYIEKAHNGANKPAMRWIGVIIKFIIWIGALLMFLDAIGVEITTLIAGLGIGGIAIAFAAQAVLEDVFSFVTIFFDRPFELGDFIVVDSLMGTVEHIGVKTTRVRSISGEQLVFSNKDLTSARLHNYKRMDSRRIVFSIGVTYDTSAENLRKIPTLIEDIICGVDGVRFERAHFKEFADSSLNFEIVYYVLSQEYNVYMDIQQTINYSLKEALDARGIEFAFPTQTLYMKQ